MIIAVSGNIGAGKTTLVRRLSKALAYKAEFEAVDHNPYLQSFYQDMRRWSFPLQVYFLSHRFKQGLSLADVKRGVVLDRTIYEDAHVFAKNLHQSGYMTDTDYDTYLHLYSSMEDIVEPPQLLIYLKGSPQKLIERIGNRGESGERKYEDEIPLNYLEDLDKMYGQWIKNYEHSPVEIIDIGKTDLAKEKNFKKLLETIQYYRDA